MTCHFEKSDVSPIGIFNPTSPPQQRLAEKLLNTPFMKFFKHSTTGWTDGACSKKCHRLSLQRTGPVGAYYTRIYILRRSSTHATLQQSSIKQTANNSEPTAPGAIR